MGTVASKSRLGSPAILLPNSSSVSVFRILVSDGWDEQFLSRQSFSSALSGSLFSSPSVISSSANRTSVVSATGDPSSTRDILASSLSGSARTQAATAVNSTSGIQSSLSLTSVNVQTPPPTMSNPSSTTAVGKGDDSAPTASAGASTTPSASSTTNRITSSDAGSSSPSRSSSEATSSGTSGSSKSSIEASGPGASDSDASFTQAANGILVPSSASSTTSDGSSEGSNSLTSNSSSQQSASHDTQAPVNTGSTSVKIVTQTFPSSTLTNTITHNQSTLSTPVGITVTSNGHTQISFPALVTLVSTSSFADGDLTTWTTIMANPTNAVGAAADNDSFTHNKGALGGTIAALVVVVLALLTGLMIYCRKRNKRRMRRRQWIHNIQTRLPVPDDPYENPREAPVMRALGQTSGNEGHYYFDSNSPHTARPFLDQEDHGPRFNAHPSAVNPSNSLGLTSMEAVRMSPFSDSPYTFNDMNPQIGLAVTTDHALGRQSRPSLAQSSPSIYPPSIPLPNDDVSVYEEVDLTNQPAEQVPPIALASRPYVQPGETIGGLPSPITPVDGPFDDVFGVEPQGSTAMAPVPVSQMISPPPAAVAAAPLRPARSILRKTGSKVVEHHLVTPPSSLSGHGHGDQDEPERERLSPSPSALSDESIHDSVPFTDRPKRSRPNSASKNIGDIFTRPTLLDVRPRPSRDNVQSFGGI
ncbi:hypothetical protein GYMLUDRAFT_52125 [Collybiopsis luxurians FD-317 M1]|nr:hypothetical protein GYMLUDRAFT_52125 [Collybiopsis luxurians FD-317 M1]